MTSVFAALWLKFDEKILDFKFVLKSEFDPSVFVFGGLKKLVIFNPKGQTPQKYRLNYKEFKFPGSFGNCATDTEAMDLLNIIDVVSITAAYIDHIIH